MVVGLFGGDVTVPTPYLPLRAMTLRGSYVGSQSDMAELLDLVKRTGMPPVPIRTRPLEEVNATLNDLRAGKIVGRVVLTPGGVLPPRKEMKAETWTQPHCARCRRRSRSATRAIPAPR